MKKYLLATAFAVAGLGMAALPALAKDYKVASIQSVTGIYAFVGVPLTKGIELGIDQVNASGMLGAGNKIVLEKQDPASERSQAVTLMTRFGNDANTLMVFGPSSTIEALASGPAAQAAKLPQITNGALPALLKVNDQLFRTLIPIPESWGLIANYAATTLKSKRCSLITVSDNEGYMYQRELVKQGLVAKGVEIVADELPRGSETDYSAIATKIVSRNPDCMILNGPAEQMANMIIQVKQAGLSPAAHVFIDSGGGSANFLKAGGKMVEGVYVLTPFFAPGATPMARQFSADYEKRFGEAPDNWSALGYASVQVVAASIKAAGTNVTRETLTAALKKTNNLPVVLGAGTMSIGEDRETHYDLTVLTVKDGKWAFP